MSSEWYVYNKFRDSCLDSGRGPCARLEDGHTAVISWEYMKSQVKIMNLCKCDSIRNNMKPRKT